MATRKKAVSRKAGPRDGGNGEVEWLGLEELRLDTGNPRFGGTAGSLKTEKSVLDAIVEKFGVEDVLSSLAVNGYFDAEPLVGIREGNRVRIVEGNRRLAACLILADDDRASNQSDRVAEYRALQASRGRPRIEKVPVRVFEPADWKSKLLPYLGVRHIAASQPWDSYAKAAWIAQVLSNGDLSLEDVVQMIGDQHRTAARMLEGYYFVRQLVDEARFKPTDSLRKGRGSNPEFPFSWVYTALGYSPIRRWLGLEEVSGSDQKPLGKKHLADAEHLMVYLFGSKQRGQAGAISDSRNISDLAKAIGDPEARQQLKRGKSVAEVAELARPAKERVVSGLIDAQEALEVVSVTLAGDALEMDEAAGLLKTSARVGSLAREVHRRIGDFARGEDEDGNGRG